MKRNNSIIELQRFGQSIWYDYIRRSLLTSGEFDELIDKGLRGANYNLIIFERVITGSADYDEELRGLMGEERSVYEIYEKLTFEDIRLAADQLMPVYESTDCKDGYVSLEIKPTLAHETEKTISEAKRLFQTLNRPNVMIKVMATPAGISAIRELIASGVNLNVTLLFSIENYKAVAEAYLMGLEKLAENGPSVSGGHPVDKVASVASFFVSRVDTAVDHALEETGKRELQGKMAIANAKVAYAEFENVFNGPRWERLAAKGAQVQRPLWAGTGTKNPLYPDTLYVDELIGPDTVNTLSQATLNSFLDHGTVAERLTKGVDEAKALLVQLSELGIDLDALTQKLQAEGVASLVKSFESLMEGIAEKCDPLSAGKKGYSTDLGGYQRAVDKALSQMKKDNIINRIWSHDHTVWKDDPKEISNRLGWLHSPEVMVDAISRINAFVDEVRTAGYTNALLLGMGGSSLAPEVYRFTFGVKEGYLDLAVLDSTDPGAVLEKAERFDPSKTLFIVSTKSGGTVETLSFMKYFSEKTIDSVGANLAGGHFVAITDPGSALEAIAQERKFRRIFLNDPNIGGRYSALSYFGLVPAGLIGMDLHLILERAAKMACNAESCNSPVAGDNTSAWLGTTMAELAIAGRDKVTFIVSPRISHFGAWVEQLIAESTGKEGRGILPVAGESVASPDKYGNDRFFVYLRLNGDSTYDARVKALKGEGQPVVQLNLRDSYDLGGEFFRWEMATVIAGARIEINPFDQPNVEAAKIKARDLMRIYQESGSIPADIPVLSDGDIEVYGGTGRRVSNLSAQLGDFLRQGHPGDYVALMAYVPRTEGIDETLNSIRLELRDRLMAATTVGYGPRFLHSTGQLHKGDGNKGLFIQVTHTPLSDVPIPGEPYTFGTLISAQALGDYHALKERGRRLIRFHIKGDIESGLKRLNKALDQVEIKTILMKNWNKG